MFRGPSRLRAFLSRRWPRRIAIGVAVLVVGGYLAFWALFFNPLEGDLEVEFAALAPEGSIVVLHVRGLRGRWEGYRTSGDLLRFERSRPLDEFMESRLWKTSVAGSTLEIALAQLRDAQDQAGVELLTEENLLDLLGEECMVVLAPGPEESLAACLVTRIPARLKFYVSAAKTFGGLFVGDDTEIREMPHGIGVGVAGEPPAFFMGRNHDCLVLATDGDLFDEVTALAAGGGGRSLADAGWSTKAEVEEGSDDPRLYVDYSRFVSVGLEETVDLVLSGDVGERLGDVYHDLIHSRALRDLEGRVSHPDNDATRLWIEIEGTHDPRRFEPGWTRYYRQPQKPFLLEKWIPPSAFYLYLLRADPGEYWKRFLARRSEVFRRTWSEFVLESGATLGRPTFFEDVVLAGSTGEFAVFALPVDYRAEEQEDVEPGKNAVPALTIAVHLKDPEGVLSVLSTSLSAHFDLWGDAGVFVERREGDLVYFDMTFGGETLEYGLGRSLRPACAVLGNVLLFTTHRSAIRAVHAVQKGRAKPLSSSSLYQRALDGPGLAANLLLLVDFQGLCETYEGFAGWQARNNAADWQLNEGHDYLVSLPEEDRPEAVLDRERLELEAIREDVLALRLLDFGAVRGIFFPDSLHCEARLGLRLEAKKR